ncbi:MAG: BatD family protein [Candidatus Omnitrophota bacterium]
MERLVKRLYTGSFARRVALMIIFCAGMLLAASAGFAKEKNFEVTLDRNRVALGETAELHLTFYGTQNIPTPKIDTIDGFQARYLGPSSMMSIVNGKMESSITHIYSLLPLRVGNFELGPFYFELGGNTYISGKIKIEVLEDAPQRSNSASGAPESMPNLDDRIFLVMSTEKTKVYINEIVPVTIKLYISRLSLRDIQYPTFGQEGFSKAEFGKHKQYTEENGGVRYDVIEFNTQVFGTKTGDFTLGPAQLKCTLVMPRERQRRSARDRFYDSGFDDPFFDSFFTRSETHPLVLKSAEVPLTVLPLPKEGKPEDFTGAIGDYQFILKADPKNVKVGDPITLRTSIYGNGNFNTVKAPVLESQENFRVYEPTMSTEKNRRVFEQVIIPESETVTGIPKIGFSYFDPDKKIYRRIVQGPLALTVTKPEGYVKPRIVEHSGAGAALVKPRDEVLGSDIVYIKDSPGVLRPKRKPLYANRIFLLFQVVPLVLLIALITAHSRFERLRKDTRYARSLRAPKEAERGVNRARRFLREKKAELFYDAIFKTLQGYLGNRLHLPSAGITSQIIDDIFRPKGVDDDIVVKLGQLFSDCDMARYAPSKLDEKSLDLTLRNLEEIIRYFERHKI